MKPARQSPIDPLLIKVLTALSYAIQAAHCVVPAAIIHEMWMDAQAGIYKDIPGRLFAIALGVFFYIYVGHCRRRFLTKLGGGHGAG